jgi:hypothetical protein
VPIAGPSSSVNGVRTGTPLNTGAAVSEGSPPKRPKVEWDGQPNEELRKEQQEVDNIQSAEDTNAFMDRMTEMWKAATEGGVGQEFIMSKIHETLALILKPDSTDDVADASALAATTSTSLLNAGGGGGGGGQQDSSTEKTALPASVVVDEFVELFDFSSWEPMDGGSKPPTPDLVSSSTNPSPESAGGAEADASATATTGLTIATGTTTAVKAMELIEPPIYEPSSDFDVFGSGIWKEIDGGESEYWSRSDWEWDRPMPQEPWAVFGAS